MVQMNDKTGKALRIVAIVLMAIAGAMNILGGVGTVCAAFLTKQFPPMWPLLDYQWLYQAIMIITIILGGANIWSVVRLSRGGRHAYRNALILLGVGTLVGAVHVFASLALRGKAVPANMKLYSNALALLFFLLIGIPGLRQRVGFSGPTDTSTRTTAGGMAAIIAGMLVLTTSLWVGSSHIFEGNNWTDVLRTPLLACGLALLAGGAWGLTSRAMRKLGEAKQPAPGRASD
jgi:hypothetical protein